MSSLLEHQDACLPITAISAVELDGSKFVLGGVGPEALLIDEDSGFLLSRLRVFERNAVHGFHTLFSGSTENEELYAKFLVWGGQSLRVIRLSLQRSLLKDNVSLSLATVECRCPDWILDVDSYEYPQNDGPQALRRRVSLITAHNTLLCAELEDKSSETGLIRLHEIGSKLKPMLYSADVKWTNHGQIVVAAGTVFGEVIVWSCRFETHIDSLCFSYPSICVHHFFTGHEGSIFGVNITDEVLIPSETEPRRFLASCSDDRTIRIWDISSCSSPGCEDKSLSVDRNVRGTGFGTYIGEMDLNEDSCVAKAFGHDARIWGVYFLDFSITENQLSFNLISRGEDLACQLWKFGFQPSSTQEANLSHIRTYNYHTGKHIWSLAVRKNPESFTIYSGGADGSLKSFLIGHHGKHDYGERMRTYTGEEILASLPNGATPLSPELIKPGKERKFAEKISKYAFISDNCFLATTTGGKILLGHVSGQEEETSVSWEYITTLDGLTAYCDVAAYPEEGIAIIADKSGEIWMYNYAECSFYNVARLDEKIAKVFALAMATEPPTPTAAPLCSIVISFIGAASAGFLQIQITESPRLVNQHELELPQSFTPTSALLLEDTSQLLLGSREGTIASFSIGGSQTTPIATSWTAPGVHGEDAVTSMTGLTDPDDSRRTENYILTTGRDGHYGVHMLQSSRESCQPSGLLTVHRSSPPLGVNLETAIFDKATNDLLITGFRSTYFVVWNETTQTEVMSVECAGTHRTWVYHHGTRTRVFLWTKVAAFNAFSRAIPSCRVLRAGGHGREVKTMDISTPIVPVNGRKLPVLATGSEDTAIRLFLLDGDEKTKPHGSFECLRTLKKQNTGLQHLQWSSCGRYLFSSSGMEEFHVWRVRYIPGFGIGAVAEGQYPKFQPHSDLRITHFDAAKVEVDRDSVDAFLIFMCYSNSAVRLFHYQSNSGKHTYTLLAEGRYTANCLTYARFIPSGSRLYAVISATDGHIATWDLTEILSPSFAVSDGKVKMGFLFQENSPAALAWEHQYAVHQSSVKALAAHAISSTSTLLVTGGDDNALSISILATPSASAPESDLVFITKCLPHAHASAINDVTVFQESRHADRAEFIIGSSGNDQRAKIWLVQFSTSTQVGSAADIKVSLKKDAYTAVADLSSMGVYNPEPHEGTTMQKLVLCGVGMDMWDVNLC